MCGSEPSRTLSTGQLERGRLPVAISPSSSVQRAREQLAARLREVRLEAASRAADQMYIEYRRVNRGGLRRLQEPANPLFLRTRSFKSYCPAVIPGFLQTPGYASALLSSIAEFREIPDDTEQAVAARMNRNRIVGDGNRRFTLLMEEEVLR
jgi:Domain of unknown function (DUF5753)